MLKDLIFTIFFEYSEMYVERNRLQRKKRDVVKTWDYWVFLDTMVKRRR